MSRAEYADIEFRPHYSGHLSALCDGKYLGHVVADGESVSVVLSRKVLSAAGRKQRDNRRTGGGVEQGELGAEAVELFKWMIVMVDFPPDVSRSIVSGLERTGRLYEGYAILRLLSGRADFLAQPEVTSD